jgi:choline dehydrogenase
MSYQADYVVVGAGAAGSVVAARLAEDGTRSVILLEAGPNTAADPTIAAAAKFPFLLDMPATVGPYPSPSHWGFTSKQNGKEYCYPRGTGLGGSTNHHATVDGRGTPLIYDEWARQTGDERWSYQRLLPFFIKMENFDVQYVDETVHGKTGWLHIKRAKLERGFHPDLLHVAMQEHGMPFRHDFYNDPKNFAGIGWCDMQVHHDGRRSNAATDLLLPTLEKIKSNGWNNLQILTDMLATRVLIDNNRAIGVEALDGARAYKADVAYRSESRTANTVTIAATKEVILCGGAINSPQLLMLSGVGPTDHLAQHGIAVVKDADLSQSRLRARSRVEIIDEAGEARIGAKRIEIGYPRMEESQRDVPTFHSLSRKGHRRFVIAERARADGEREGRHVLVGAARQQFVVDSVRSLESRMFSRRSFRNVALA